MGDVLAGFSLASKASPAAEIDPKDREMFEENDLSESVGRLGH